ncbi:MAG: FAD-dependent oxidoreductase [Chloroflexi bacterium]|nr:FAD-dependent oxidoreductase [Chloroflexota bacterium]
MTQSSKFPSHARVVIIGGGVGGASIAYHLTLMGWRDVVVLERSELTSGSTFHSAGLVGQLRTSSNLTKMIRYSTDLYRRLKDETEVDPGWREVGSLRLASSKARLEELKYLVAVSRSFGLPLELISATEAQKLFPLMTTDGVEGAVYLPTDGYIDPTGLTMALVAGAKARGAQFCTHTRVQDITLNASTSSAPRVSAVVTDQGTIETEIVVNAAGQWAGEIGRMVRAPNGEQLNFPIISMAHLYLITKPMGITQTLPRGMRGLPTLRDPDLLVYFREEVGGLIMGGYERAPAAWALDGIPQDFNGKLLPPDWDRFAPLMENAIRRVPEIENAQVNMLLNGPEGFTPDAEYLLGPTSVRGFWIAAAFCAHGLAGAGGIGKAMAEWIIEGHPEWDLWRLDHRRFGANYASQKYTLARTLETYAKYYDIHYPNEERESARPLRLSPAYHRLKEFGASFGEKTGWERPNWFNRDWRLETRASSLQLPVSSDQSPVSSDQSPVPSHQSPVSDYSPRGWARHNWSPNIGAEHLGTRERAGLFDETSFSKISVRGPGALKLLNYLCDNEMDKPMGAVTYTQMLNPRGGIECDFTVTRLAHDEFQIITGAAFGAHDLQHIQTHAPDDGSVIVEDVTSHYACLGLWGPRARDILQRVTKSNVSNDAFPYMTAQRIAVGDVPCLALRVTYVGELGWEFYCPMEYGQKLWDTLWGAGQAFGMVAGGYRAIDTLRLEKGYRYWSAEIGPDYTPYEAGLGFCVKLNGANGAPRNFAGRDALVKQKAEGLARKLCCLTLNDPTAITIGSEPLRYNDRVIGWAQAGAYGYSVQKSIAYAYLPIELAVLGATLDVELIGERIGAVVAQDPQWDPKGERIQC